MKFFLSFVGVLVAILVLVRFFPSAPINPVLPVQQGQKEVNGHDAEVPKGSGDESKDDEPAPGSTRASAHGAFLVPA